MSDSNARQITGIGQIGVTVVTSTPPSPSPDCAGLTSCSVPVQVLPSSTRTVSVLLTTPQGAGSVGHNSLLYFKVSDIQGTYQLSSIAARSASVPRTRCYVAGP